MKSTRQYYEEELAAIRGRLNFYTEWGCSPDLQPLVDVLRDAERNIISAMDLLEPKEVVVMTNVLCSKGSYVIFVDRSLGRRLAVVRRSIDGRRCDVLAGTPFLEEIGSRTRKDAALELAKKTVLKIVPNAKFKWNVVTKREP